MTRCEQCDLPIGKTGLVCVSCKRAFCKRHATEGVDIGCCDSCVRQCSGCTAVKPASEGVDVGEMDWLCKVCLRGHAVIAVKLSPLDACELPRFDVELHLPQVPIYEESNEVVA